MAHALLSPSSAHRWTQCKGSVYLTKDLPNVSGAAADYGTLAHECAEKILAKEATLSDLILEHPEIDEPMIEGINIYLKEIESLREPTSVLHVEYKLPVGRITTEKNGQGTADAIIINSEELIIADLKFGRSKVSAKDNYQLKIYALAAALHFDWDKQIKVGIIQPLLNYKEYETYTVKELKAWGKTITAISKEVLDMANGKVRPEFKPDNKTCKWCKGIAHCPALAEEMFEMMEDKFAPLDRLAQYIDIARRWADSVEQRSLDALIAGEKFDFMELGQGRDGNRKWIDEKQAEETVKTFLGSKAYVQKLISPTQAAKLTDVDFSYLVTREPGKPKIIFTNEKN